MKKHLGRLAGAGIFLAVIALFGLAVLLLWNRLLPVIFGVPEIHYGQAVGLLVLTHILFGGIGLGGGRRLAAGMGLAGIRGHDNPFREKWLHMTEEERKEFIAQRHHGFHEFYGRTGGRDDKNTPNGHDNTKADDVQ
jgi:hypothetical protein